MFKLDQYSLVEYLIPRVPVLDRLVVYKYIRKLGLLKKLSFFTFILAIFYLVRQTTQTRLSNGEINVKLMKRLCDLVALV